MNNIIGKILLKEFDRQNNRVDMVVQDDNLSEYYIQVRSRDIAKIACFDTGDEVNITVQNVMRENRKEGKTSRFNNLILKEAISA